MLFGEHTERRRTEGKTVDENAKAETTVTLQESLMRLFAVCNEFWLAVFSVCSNTFNTTFMM